MSNAIRFLELLGRRTPLSPADYAASVAQLEVDDAQRRALLHRDPAALSALLGGRQKLMFAILAPEEAQVRDA